MDLERIKTALAAATPAPIYAKLRQAIYDQIKDGSLHPGESLPSEGQLQTYFDVSRTTICQAINALIQEGLLQSVAGTGTFVLDRTAQRSTPALIAMIVSGVNFHFFYPQLLTSFDEQIRRAGYALTVATHNESVELLEAIADDFLAQGVVGLVVTPPRLGDFDRLLKKWERAGVTVACVGRRVQNPNIDCVATDNVDIGYRATEVLIELGHRDIVHVGLNDYITGFDRAEGYQQAMQAAGLRPAVVSVQEHLPHEDGTAAAQTPREHLAEPAGQAIRAYWTQAARKPTALFAFNDVMAMGIYKVMREMGLRIPEQVSLISVDDLITIHHFEVPLTTFRLPSAAIGLNAAALLLERIAAPNRAARQLLLPAKLIKRASTAPPA